MNTKRLVTAIAMAGLLVIGACTTDTADPEVSDDVEQNAVDLAAEVETQMTNLAIEIQDSEAAADLQAAWGDVQAEITAAIASMGTDGTIQTENLGEELDEFQAELEAAGDAVTPELLQAWEALRSSVEQMMS